LDGILLVAGGITGVYSIRGIVRVQALGLRVNGKKQNNPSVVLGVSFGKRGENNRKRLVTPLDAGGLQEQEMWLEL